MLEQPEQIEQIKLTRKQTRNYINALMGDILKEDDMVMYEEARRDKLKKEHGIIDDSIINHKYFGQRSKARSTYVRKKKP